MEVEQGKGQVTPENEETSGQEIEEQPESERETDAPKVEPKYTDQDVDKLKGTARTEARERRDRELLEKYNLESLDELDEIIEAHNEFQESIKTEVEKATGERDAIAKERDTLQSELDEAYETISRVVTESELKAALADAGLNPGRMKAAMRLADTDRIEIDDEGNVTGVKDVVKAIREESPEWFASNKAGVPLSPNGSGGGSKLSHEERMKQSNLSSMRL